MYIVTLDQDSPEYLEHFGVLGMHWGVRNSETQRKYNGGQEHSEARTDIVKPTEGHSYQGQFKPSLSKDQTKMLKRAAAGVAIGAGLAAGVAVGMKSGALKTVAKHGARKLADTARLQARGKEFAKRVRTQSGRNEIKRAVAARKSDISSTAKRQVVNARRLASTTPQKAVAKAKSTRLKIWDSKRMAPVKKANERFNYYTKNPKGKKKTVNRLTIGATGAAFVSAPLIEGHEVDKRVLRRKNGRHASTKWMRNKERLS